MPTRLPLRRTWRRQLPLTAVLAVVVVGLVVVALDHWVVGLDVVGAALALAAVLRSVLPRRTVGLLAVRSRWFDVLLLAGAATGLIVITTSLR